MGDGQRDRAEEQAHTEPDRDERDESRRDRVLLVGRHLSSFRFR
jgi:hypothetical protein